MDPECISMEARDPAARDPAQHAESATHVQAVQATVQSPSIPSNSQPHGNDAVARSLREELEKIKNLTFLSPCTATLLRLSAQLRDIHDELLNTCPAQSGLLLQESPLKTRKNSTNDLPLRKKRKRMPAKVKSHNYTCI